MASRSRKKPAPKRGQRNPLSEFGIFDIPDLDSVDDEPEGDVDESTLESELEALLSGKLPSKPSRPKPKVAPVLDIEALAAECMEDVVEEEGGDEDVDDEDLLSELHSLTKTSPLDEGMEETVSEENPCANLSPAPSHDHSIIDILEERLSMYKDAISVVKANNESSKVRRYERSKKTIEGLLIKAKSGSSITDDEIPPIINVPKGTKASTLPSEPVNEGIKDESKISSDTDYSDLPAKEISSEQTESKNSTLKLLMIRRDQYKMAALEAKRDGNKEAALSYLKIVKNFNAVIEAINSNHPVDLSNIPPPPEGYSGFISITPQNNTEKVVKGESQTSSCAEQSAAPTTDDSQLDVPPPPSTALEALQQRLEKYKIKQKEAAEIEGSASKARRLNRVIKKYETVINDLESGKDISAEVFDDLPVPPGFPPFPVFGIHNVSTPPPSEEGNRMTTHSEEAEKISPEVPPGEKQDNDASSSKTLPTKKPRAVRSKAVRESRETQLQFLLERQKLFREAALTSKRNGNIEEAKLYLRMSKGFDTMIDAAKGGLPVDTTNIPTPPQLESDFVIVDAAECVFNEDQSEGQLFESLEKDLNHQIEACTRNKEHFLHQGDIAGASKFEKLCLESKKDLTVIEHLKKNGNPIPRFHYETRLFSMVLSHTDLGDNIIEVSIIRGINLPGKPDSLDSFVRVELPIPSDNPQHAKTKTIYDTNNPVYDEVFKFEFNRRARSHLRLFKRQTLRLQVMSKGGFLKSDTQLGTASIKLIDLESKCSIHDSFELYQSRKLSGGKLEVKIRIREPLVSKQVQEVKEKWLVIGS